MFDTPLIRGLCTDHNAIRVTVSLCPHRADSPRICGNNPCGTLLPRNPPQKAFKRDEFCRAHLFFPGLVNCHTRDFDAVQTQLHVLGFAPVKDPFFDCATYVHLPTGHTSMRSRSPLTPLRKGMTMNRAVCGSRMVASLVALMREANQHKNCICIQCLCGVD